MDDFIMHLLQARNKANGSLRKFMQMCPPFYHPANRALWRYLFVDVRKKKGGTLK
jgi:hypothetical protein